MQPPFQRRHSRSTPRSWLSLYIRLGGWVSLILAAFLLLMTLFSATQLVIADRLDADGAFATAVVTDRQVRVSTDTDGDESRSYHASFRYKDARFGGQEQTRNVGFDYYSSVAVGDEVTIRYLRSDPATFEYEIGQYRSDGNILRWLALFFGVVGLVLLWRFGRETTEALLVRRDGETRVAQVVEIHETSVRINKRRQARLVWEEPDGQRGESLLHDVEKLSELYRAGDPITVFRLGDAAYWEGDVGPRKQGGA
jgi:hypothetical protein